MSRKYAGNEFKKRWVFSSWRNVDNDSTHITSAVKLFQFREPTTGKAQLVTVGSLTGGTCLVLTLCVRKKHVTTYWMIS